MDAINFVNEKVRMCSSISANGCNCSDCSLSELGGCTLDYLVKTGNVEKAVEFVEEWSKKNLLKTRQSVFIQQYPKVNMYNGLIGIRPCQMEEGYTSKYCTCDSSQCIQCRKEYWLQGVE